MKNRCFFVVMLSFWLLFCFTEEVNARAKPKKTPFVTNKQFGLGIALGAPSGISGKYYLSANTAIDFGFGTGHGSFADKRLGHHGVHFHSDFLWHVAVLTKNKNFWLPLYFGIGGWMVSHDEGEHTHLGPRLPFGILMDFENIALDLFLEFAFAADLLVGSEGHRFANGDMAIGVRYYF